MDHPNDLIFSILEGVKFIFVWQELKRATVTNSPFQKKNHPAIFVNWCVRTCCTIVYMPSLGLPRSAPMTRHRKWYCIFASCSGPRTALLLSLKPYLTVIFVWFFHSVALRHHLIIQKWYSVLIITCFAISLKITFHRRYARNWILFLSRSKWQFFFDILITK